MSSGPAHSLAIPTREPHLRLFPMPIKVTKEFHTPKALPLCSLALSPGHDHTGTPQPDPTSPPVLPAARPAPPLALALILQIAEHSFLLLPGSVHKIIPDLEDKDEGSPRGPWVCLST